MTTSRRPRPLKRDVSIKRDARLIIIATEGAQTEPQYFRMFGDSRVRIEILKTTEEDGSHAIHVLRRLKKYAREYSIGKNDELWLVIDKDRNNTDDVLRDIAQECMQRGYGLAVSVPLFELWLVLHLESVNIEALTVKDDFKKMLKEGLGGYKKANLKLEYFKDGVDLAVERARALDINPEDRWPQTIGSRVYRLIESIRRLGDMTQ